MASYSLKIYSYNSDGDKVATKNFSAIPTNVESDPQSLRKFVNKYAALTSADSTKADLVKVTAVDLG